VGSLLEQLGQIQEFGEVTHLRYGLPKAVSCRGPKGILLHKMFLEMGFPRMLEHSEAN